MFCLSIENNDIAGTSKTWTLAYSVPGWEQYENHDPCLQMDVTENNNNEKR